MVPFIKRKIAGVAELEPEPKEYFGPATLENR
jgi:hypothetical protein